MKKLFYFLSSSNLLCNFALKLIINRIVHFKGPLTEEYLIRKGWIWEDGFWMQSGVKDRDKVWIKIEGRFFRVWHGKDRAAFIALESSVEWLELYLLLVRPDNGRYKLAGV